MCRGGTSDAHGTRQVGYVVMMLYHEIYMFDLILQIYFV